MTAVLLCMGAWLVFCAAVWIGLGYEAAHAPAEPPGEHWG